MESFRALLQARWLDDFTLQEVAEGAGVTQQTVIRKFGGKAGLLLALGEQLGREAYSRRAESAENLDAVVGSLVDDYETLGDFVMRLLAQEGRFPSLTPFLDVGRRGHRTWVAQVFASQLAPLQPADREAAIDALVAATDLYLWQLLRRDLGYELARVRAAVRRLVGGILDALASEARG